MCGRYAASAAVSELVTEYEVTEVELPEAAARPRFNIAPTDTVAALVERPARGDGPTARRLMGMRWGLVPSWSKGPGGAPLINARQETVARKPSFRSAFARRRCLLPADGYYEWYQLGGSPNPAKPAKQPFFIHPEQGRLAMAGLYEFWRDPAGAWLASCAIITTTATDAMGHIHDRMPMTVVDVASWLDPTLTDEQAVDTLLVAPSGLSAYAVSTLVSNVRNDGPELLTPLPLEEA